MTLRHYLSSLFLLAALVQPHLASASPALIGEHVYLRVNVWCDDDHRILSINYHEGLLVPAGTAVVITEITPESVRFDETSGDRNSYLLLNVKRHEMDVTTEDLMARLFSTEDPLVPGGPFDTFTEEEKGNIRSGTLAEGMGRDAVLMAYGYPPRYQTSSLVENIWVYWDTRWIKKMLYFENDRVVQIADTEDR